MLWRQGKFRTTGVDAAFMPRARPSTNITVRRVPGRGPGAATPNKKPAPKRGFLSITAGAASRPYSAASAPLKVVLGRIAAEALATSGR